MIKNKKLYMFHSKNIKFRCKKKWIISSLNSSGKIYIDIGAAKALLNGKSLLAAGVLRIKVNLKKEIMF